MIAGELTAWLIVHTGLAHLLALAISLGVIVRWLYRMHELGKTPWGQR